MGIVKSYLKPTVAAVCCAIAILQPRVVLAEDAEVLLQRLRDADPIEAQMIARALQLEWDKSGSATADLLLRRGRAAIERSEFEAAIDHLTALIDHAPDFAEGYVTRAAAYFRADLYGPAIEDLGKALALNPDNYNAIMGLATIFEMLDKPKDAYEAFKRAEAIHPTHEKVREALDRLEPKARGRTL